MLGEASSPFSIPASGQYYNTFVYKIFKYTIRFESNDHSNLKSLTDQMMLSEASSLLCILVAGQC